MSRAELSEEARRAVLGVPLPAVTIGPDEIEGVVAYGLECALAAAPHVACYAVIDYIESLTTLLKSGNLQT